MLHRIPGLEQTRHVEDTENEQEEDHRDDCELHKNLPAISLRSVSSCQAPIESHLFNQVQGANLLRDLRENAG